MWSAFSPRPPTPTARRCCLRCQTWTASANLRASRCTANCRRRWRPRAAAVFVPAARVRKHAARPRRRCCARSRPAAALRATFRTSLHHEPEPGCIADPAAQRRGHFARQPEPPPAGRLWRHRVRDPPDPPLLRQPPALLPALCRLAAVHAGAPRYLVRCAGLPLAPLGLDRSLGGRDHLLAAQRRRRHPTDLGPPAPVRERRRKLPRRLSGLGLSARPRNRPVEKGAKRKRHPRPGAPVHQVLPGPFPHEYDTNRTWFKREEDFPGPQPMASAARWIDENAGRHQRFFLMIDEFDPHEPFDTPQPWACRYRQAQGADEHQPLLVWPPYAVDAIERGVLTAAQAQELRSNYGAKLSMIDHWLGRVLDAIERNRLAADTAVILCTDHGHYLGERDIFGKPGGPLYQPMAHIPLMIRWPGMAPGRRDMLTTSVDIHATIADIFRVSAPHPPHRRAPPAGALAAARHRRSGPAGARAFAGRRLGPRGALHRPQPQIRSRPGAGQRAAIDVVQPLVDDAAAPCAGPASAAARPPRAHRLHARQPGAGAAPALRRGRPAAAMGAEPAVQRQPPVEPRRRPRRADRSGRQRAGGRVRAQTARRAAGHRGAG